MYLNDLTNTGYMYCTKMKVVKLRPVLLPESFLYYLYYQLYEDLKHFTFK